MDRVAAERLILQRGWLSEQPEEARAAVLQRARLVKHDAGDFVFHAGDEAGGICGVVSGGIGIYLPTEPDGLRLAHIGRRGVWFGYGPLIRGRRRVLSFSPTETTWLLHVPLLALQEIAAASLLHQRAVLSVGEYGMDAAITIIENLLVQNHARRIAGALLRVTPGIDEDPGHAAVEVILTQSQLGEMASVGRQVVNRELQRLQARGWISVSYSRIMVLNRSALVMFAQGVT
ncbi:Crp/Fnr family transcriptional regulator [Aestuariivirga litoralis]|nr:Crp/Fnr family transcriptional regulator [Aestuariivirga litoralis]